MQSFSILLLSSLVVIAGAALLWSVARRYRREIGIQKEESEKATETAFIINAFHEVTKQLKEKEKELERLKSLAEQHAENVESYNKNILQCVTSGVMTFDKNGLATTINRAAEDILGISWAQAAGKNCQDIFSSGDICKAVRDTIEEKLPSTRMETTLDRPQGKTWLGFNTAVLADRQQGEVLGVILSFSDLTEVKRLQEQMELKERLTALGEMSAGIAHELRNPMAVILGYINLLSKKIDPANQNIIRDITSEINGMNRIIGDLLTFARPASLNRVSVNIKELIEGCLSNVLQAKDAVAKITPILRLDDAAAFLDEGLMRQVFNNLFQNAVEAMPDGGTLTVDAHGGRNLTVTVADTGTGVPKDTIKKIFLPFFTTKDKGVGLGLALVHKIVLSHGGRLEVQSTQGKGTAFTVIIPAR
ncbi:MAG: two-component system sensor histidine kinase NtrB [Nitrospirota bacterium]|nr:ATP-binding protein [Nitrospirota bacterium]